MVIYNMSLVNGSGLVPLMQTTNDVFMFGWFGNMALITIFAMFFLTFITRTNDAKKSLGFSTLITALISIFFRNLSLINDITVLITWLLAGIIAFIIAINPD